MCKEKQIELTRQDLIVGHVYEGKRKQADFCRLINDRQIIWIGKEFYKGEFQEVIQYDSPTVRNGKHYPKVSIAQFLKWAKRDITAEMPKDEWRTMNFAEK